MPGMNSFNAYEMDPRYDGGEGDLPGALRSMDAPGLGGSPHPPGNLGDIYGLSGLLLGGLLAHHLLQQPPVQDSAQPQPGSQDPNFRQLMRVNPAANSAKDTSDQSQPNSPTQTQMAAPAIAGSRPPMSPLPPVSLPDIPDWLKDAWTILLRKGGGSGGGRRSRRPNDDDGDGYCDRRESAERGRCFTRYEDVSDPRNLHGCLDRAKYRNGLCRDDRPDPSEPPE